MGYEFRVINSDWLLPKENFDEAYQSMRLLIGNETINKNYLPNLEGKPHFSFVDPEEFETAPDLISALNAWRWKFFDFDDGLEEPELIGEERKLGDDQLLFSVLAPYVKQGSYIDLMGEDCKIWRWEFKDNELIRRDGKITFQ